MARTTLAGSLVASLYCASVLCAPACAAPLDLGYDYVVVGSGPGGLTIANRLSEDPKVTVAVIEAGPWTEQATGNQSQIPAYDFFYTGKDPQDTNPAVEWGFVTTPQQV
jgi:choline dehydrogenase